jgi:plasmid maintenance system antidote protein VapI
MTKTERRPVYPIHPSTILAEELTELNISATELARQLHVPSK